MLTLVHEDIYVYVDKIEEQLQSLSGSNSFALTNNATDLKVDPGVIVIDALTGSYTSLTLTAGYNTLTINQPLSAGSQMVLDLRNKRYTIDGAAFFLTDVLDMRDDVNHNLTLSLLGTGTAEIKYSRNQAVTNDMDLFFCTGLDVTENYTVITKNNIKGQTKIHKNEITSMQWSINGLWNDTELQKFESSTGLFRLRLVDEEGTGLEKLANCVIASFQRTSSDSGDYTYTLNGSVGKIFN